MVGVEDLPSGDQGGKPDFLPEVNGPQNWLEEGFWELWAYWYILYIYIIYIYILQTVKTIYIYMYMCTIATKDLTMRDDASFL